MPLWGTLIAVYDGEDVVVGVLEQPVLQERFIATNFATRSDSEDSISATADIRSSELMTPHGRRSLSTRKTQSLGDAIVQTTSPEYFFESGHAAVLDRVDNSVSMIRYGGDCYCYA